MRCAPPGKLECGVRNGELDGPVKAGEKSRKSVKPCSFVRLQKSSYCDVEGDWRVGAWRCDGTVPLVKDCAEAEAQGWGREEAELLVSR